MRVRPSSALAAVRTSVDSAARRSAARRLTVYPDDIPCRPGCSGCCKRMNSVTVAEAVLLYEDMSRSGAWPRARAEALAQIPLLRGTNAVSWFKMNRPCPVLSSNGMCSAYRVRPIACSTHFVTSDPSSCDPWAMGASEYSPLDFRDVAMEETERMVRTLEEGGILQLELPMPQALMVAERVSTRSGLTLEQVTSYVMNEL